MLAGTLSQIIASAPFVPDAHRVFLFDGRENSVQVLRVWPAPRVASYRLDDGRWWPSSLSAHGAVLARPYEPHFDGDELDWWSVDVRPLFLQIPSCVRLAVGQMPRIYAWKVLRLLAVAPGAIDLVRHHPVLAGLLAFDGRTLYSDKPFYEHALREDFLPLLEKPRRRLLPLLGLPDAGWIVRVLSKMDLRVLIEPGIDPLLELLTRAQKDTKLRRRLQHLERLPADVTEVLADETLRRMTTFGLLSDGSRPPAVHLAACLEPLREAGTTRRFDSWAGLEKALLALPAERRRLRSEQWDPAEYPDEFETPTGDTVLPEDPPVVLTPLRTADAMLSHGIRQLACVPTEEEFPKRAAAGSGAMYEVTWGEERELASLWLRRRDGGRWFIEDLRGPENARVSPGLEQRVGAWVASVVAGTLSDPPRLHPDHHAHGHPHPALLRSHRRPGLPRRRTRRRDPRRGAPRLAEPRLVQLQRRRRLGGVSPRRACCCVAVPAPALVARGVT